MAKLKRLIVTDDERVFPYGPVGLAEALNHEHFTLDRVCKKCKKKCAREENFCFLCGMQTVAPTPCPNHGPGNMEDQGFYVVERAVPGWYVALTSDYAILLKECLACGHVQ